MKKMKENQEIGKSMAMTEIIKEIEKDIVVLASKTGQAYIKYVSESNEVFILPVDSFEFENWFREVCYFRYDLIVPAGGHKQAQEHMKMLARHSERYQLSRRVYCNIKEGSIYYDMGRTDGKYLRITSEKIKLVKTSKALFLRDKVFSPQCEPDLEADPKEVMYYIKKHFNFATKEQELLFAVFLVSCFFGRTMPLPICEFFGSQGSSKSTCLKRVRDLIDPHSVGLYSMPKREDDISILLESDYLVCFDNISFISQDVSNLLCRNCTGSAQVRRKLYSDNGTVMFDIGAIVCFSSTRQCIVRGDLADRTLFFELQRISPEDMESEKNLREQWEDDLPQFFGSLVKAVQAVLRDKSYISVKSPFRLVDFFELALRAGQCMGYSDTQVREAFLENAMIANDAVMTENTVLSVVEAFMEQEENKEGLELQVTEFYRQIKIFALEELSIDGRSFPGAPEVLSRMLSENRTDLEKVGIFYKIKRGKNARYISMWRE